MPRQPATLRILPRRTAAPISLASGYVVIALLPVSMEDSRTNQLGPRPNGQPTRPLPWESPSALLATMTKVAVMAVVCISFWTAVFLPAVYFYLLYHGLTTGELVLMGKLFGVHAVALVAGRGYNVGGGYGDSVSAFRDQGRSF